MCRCRIPRRIRARGPARARARCRIRTVVRTSCAMATRCTRLRGGITLTCGPSPARTAFTISIGFTPDNGCEFPVVAGKTKNQVSRRNLVFCLPFSLLDVRAMKLVVNHQNSQHPAHRLIAPDCVRAASIKLRGRECVEPRECVRARRGERG